MPILPMATTSANELPPVFLESSDDFPDLHAEVSTRTSTLRGVDSGSQLVLRCAFAAGVVGLTFRAERLRPAAQLVQNKLTDRRTEVRSSSELDRRLCPTFDRAT